MNKKFTRLISVKGIKSGTTYCLGCLIALNLNTFQTFAKGINREKSLLEAKQLIVSEKADILIRGVVKDENGETLPGVGIKVKGALTSTTTDINGNFSITVLSESAILMFSYIGYAN